MDDEEERTPHGAAHDIKEKGVLDNGQLGQNFRSSPNSLAESPCWLKPQYSSQRTRNEISKVNDDIVYLYDSHHDRC